MGPRAHTGSGARLAALAFLLLRAVPAQGAEPARPTGGPPLTPRIVNGTLTVEHPAAGALLVGDDPEVAESWCSGVLIGCQTFLTAAHCVCEGSGRTCQGRRAPSPNGRLVFLQHAGFFEVSRIRVHPDFAFPVADLALVKLAAPVTGVAPVPLATVPPSPGTAGTIVGFGRGGGETVDYGLKRAGAILTSACPRSISSETSLCWRFTGAGANSCNGDSGGPLFVDLGSGPVVAGVTSGGAHNTCLADDLAYDASVAPYAAWIRNQAGGDLDRATCGGMPPAGAPGAPIVGMTGVLGEMTASESHILTVPPGTNELRVALNASDDDRANFDLYVRAGAPPTSTDYDCRAGGPTQYGWCAFRFPTPGTWYVLVQRVAGAGAYQVAATIIGGAPPTCGNERVDTAEECDGTDDAACPGACDVDCTCLHPCTQDELAGLRVRGGGRVVVKALLRNGSGSYDGLVPPAVDLALTLDDGTVPVDVIIPAGDPGWDTSANRRDGVFLWRGYAGARPVAVRYTRVRNGDWHVTVKLGGPAAGGG